MGKLALNLKYNQKYMSDQIIRNIPQHCFQATALCHCTES